MSKENLLGSKWAKKDIKEGLYVNIPDNIRSVKEDEVVVYHDSPLGIGIREINSGETHIVGRFELVQYFVRVG